MKINTKEELILQGEDDKILNRLKKRKTWKGTRIDGRNETNSDTRRNHCSKY